MFRIARLNLSKKIAIGSTAAAAVVVASSLSSSPIGVRASLHSTATQLWAATTHTLGAFTSSPLRMASDDSNQWPKGKSEDEWRVQLSPEQFRILRKKGTEMAGTGEYDSHYPQKGVYECAGKSIVDVILAQQEIMTSLSPSSTAHASFSHTRRLWFPAVQLFNKVQIRLRPGAVVQKTDSSWGMQRTEILCAQCGGHLGHLFKGEGFNTPTDERACVNSVSIKYNPNGEEQK
ncbi:hypothetical protein OIV83_003601 [Microbotryomycetes sp. JL201]|nr:hypothetical protein OIV83_003601 [Microbotryomycetes sp. JL201]